MRIHTRWQRYYYYYKSFILFFYFCYFCSFMMFSSLVHTTWKQIIKINYNFIMFVVCFIVSELIICLFSSYSLIYLFLFFVHGIFLNGQYQMNIWATNYSCVYMNVCCICIFVSYDLFYLFNKGVYVWNMIMTTSNSV